MFQIPAKQGFSKRWDYAVEESWPFTPKSYTKLTEDPFKLQSLFHVWHRNAAVLSLNLITCFFSVMLVNKGVRYSFNAPLLYLWKYKDFFS